MKLTTLTALLLFTCTCFAQDIITLRTGTEIKAKVTEVDSPAIRYKKFENLDGPTYKLTTGEVFTIKYANGTKEFYGTAPAVTTTAPVTAQVNTVTPYDSLMKRANSNKVGAIIGLATGPLFMGAGAGMIGLGFITTDPTMVGLNIGIGSFLVIAGAAEIILGSVCVVKYGKQKRAADQLKTPTAIIKPFATGTGTSASVGMRVTF